MIGEALLESCRATLRANDRGGYTIPAQGLYPFQWLWDAGFIALGWATFDEERAWLELDLLMRAQWQGGMVPHIVFHEASPGYFPGPEVWQGPGPLPSSGITQPPVLATVARRLVTRARNSALAEEKLRNLYPRLLAYHRWFYRARDPHGSGLVAMLHPWESGMDNSPAWDEALARVEGVELGSARRDTGHVAAEERPQTEDYRRYLGLVSLFRDHGYDENVLYDLSPFKVAGLVFNALLHRANLDLLAVAQSLGETDTAELEGWIARAPAAIVTLWHEEDGFFYPRDLVTGELIRIRTWEGFLPLTAGLATPEQAERLAESAEAWRRSLRFFLPCSDPTHPSFAPRRYWRGPVWTNVNWLLYWGFNAYGFGALASGLREDSVALAERFGLREYYDPTSGEGLGGKDFSWTVALLLDWQSGGDTLA